MLLKTVAQPTTLPNYCVMYAPQFVALSIALPLLISHILNMRDWERPPAHLHLSKFRWLRATQALYFGSSWSGVADGATVLFMVFSWVKAVAHEWGREC